MIVEVLTFEGCPHGGRALTTLERLIDELGVDADVRVVDVPDADAAEKLRFLGSPTIRIDGRDVEPGADSRTDYVLACRIYPTQAGYADQPDERLLRQALTGASEAASDRG